MLLGGGRACWLGVTYCICNYAVILRVQPLLDTLQSSLMCSGIAQSHRDVPPSEACSGVVLLCAGLAGAGTGFLREQKQALRHCVVTGHYY